MSLRKKIKNRRLRALRHTFEFVLLQGLEGAFALVPAAWHGWVARATGYFFATLFPFRQRVLIENLSMAFPELAPTERRRLLRGIYCNGVLFALEMARLRRASPAEIAAAVELCPEADDLVAALRAQGRGYLIASAHMGNWEWLGAWYAQTYGNFGVIYKPMHNPRSEQLLLAMRRHHRMTIFSTRETKPRALFNHLRDGGAVAVLADQDAGQRGLFLPFFGRPASTYNGPASLACRLGVPILPAFCLRQRSGKFRIKLFPLVTPDPAADRAEEERRIMTEYNRMVEEVVRLAPEQYFWWHRRWKTTPRAAKR